MSDGYFVTEPGGPKPPSDTDRQKVEPEPKATTPEATSTKDNQPEWLRQALAKKPPRGWDCT
ncbi:MAG TPA: hypothetical protein VG984_03325 [Candidatus Paceibacterota bacterium]|nr:hypothetical protein [Candidatus Paceibacterota bacterium]